MPPSQLKRLKASLREQGLVGPQKSKKQKKNTAQHGATQERRVRKSTALTGIREQFNPFEVKSNAKGPKFQVTSNRTLSGRTWEGVKSRPGLMKGLGEETRRKTLLKELQRRRKVGGIVDRRFGENDPTMAPEEKMLERFTQEKQRLHKGAVFDLEDEDSADGLTHMGQTLSLDGPVIADDFDDDDLLDVDDHPSADDGKSRKRRRETNESNEDVEDDGLTPPAPKKSRQEVMQELIAKSKLHKYERQAAKDEDQDLREELDKELPNIQDLLHGNVPNSASTPVTELHSMNPDRAALLNRVDKLKLEKEYDMRLKQLAQDQKSKPSERTKTEAEIVKDESSRLRQLERRRQLRMQGASELEDDGGVASQVGLEQPESEEDFGFGSGIKARPGTNDFVMQDEDDFYIENDLVASDVTSESSEEQDLAEDTEHRKDDDDMVAGPFTTNEFQRPDFLTGANAPIEELDLSVSNGVNGDLAFTFTCPQTHLELLEVVKDIALVDLPIVVQRIRALYHPQLKSENRTKLANFACSLIDHISYLANQAQTDALLPLENLIRHVHSLAKMYPVEIANSFRKHLQELNESRPLTPTAGDLIVLTAIGTIYPTSDHFHQVVTPAMLSMTRYLGQKIPQKVSDYARGTYLCTLCLQYQSFSKRYVPEMVNFIENSLCVLAPEALFIPSFFPRHVPKQSMCIVEPSQFVGTINFKDIVSQELSESQQALLKVAVLETNLRLLDIAVDTWIGMPAFTEVFDPATKILQHLSSSRCRAKLPGSSQSLAKKLYQKLQHLLNLARLSRRPLELHHHRPLAIKTSIPKFEESFDPDKHYDPNRERAEAAKLRAQHKKEKKGAMRELRKDANFIARESLREKKERDAAHEQKMKRLIAEIQGEEGHEAKAYRRGKEWRKKGR